MSSSESYSKLLDDALVAQSQEGLGPTSTGIMLCLGALLVVGGSAAVVAGIRETSGADKLAHFDADKPARIISMGASSLTLEQCGLMPMEDPNSNNKFAKNHGDTHCEDKTIDKIPMSVLSKYMNSPTAVASQVQAEVGAR